MTKGITIATAKAVAAGNSARQEDIIHTANLSRKAMSDMLSTCKVRRVFAPTLLKKRFLLLNVRLWLDFSKRPTTQMSVRR